MRSTSHIGEVSRTQVIAALARAGKEVLIPLGDYRRYDLVIDDGGKFARVQCKTGRLIAGVIGFDTCSIDSRSVKGRCLRRPYEGDIEYFGVYCPDNNKVYLVPVRDAPKNRCFLRVEPPRNGQRTRVRWAQDYELSERVELTGFEPVTF